MSNTQYYKLSHTIDAQSKPILSTAKDKMQTEVFVVQTITTITVDAEQFFNVTNGYWSFLGVVQSFYNDTQ